MSIEKISENLIIATLPDEEKINEILKSLNDKVTDGDNCDIIIDFSRVETITSSGISNLLILRGLMKKINRKLIICSIKMATRCIFTVTGIDDIFEIADDKYAAKQAIEKND